MKIESKFKAMLPPENISRSCLLFKYLTGDYLNMDKVKFLNQTSFLQKFLVTNTFRFHHLHPIKVITDYDGFNLFRTRDFFQRLRLPIQSGLIGSTERRKANEAM